MERVFRDVWKRLDLSFDDFIRTTDRKRHFPAVQKMAQACLRQRRHLRGRRTKAGTA